MHGGRRTPGGLLAVVYAVSGLLCLAGAAWPMHEDTPVRLLWALGAVGLLGAVLLFALAHRAAPWLLHAAVALLSALIAVLAWRSATPAGIVGLAPAMVTVGLFTGHFFPLTAVRWHVGGLLVASTVAAIAAAPSGFVQAWLCVLVTVAVLAEVQGRLAGQLRSAADTDPLTGVANRRAWELQTSRQLAHAERTGEPLSVVILDLDDFKLVNDQDGHGAGDALLRDLTLGWSRRLRAADLLGRYGGDEFVLCLPATDADGTAELLAQLEATHDFRWSVGVAMARAGETLQELLGRADADLYLQKRGGRPR